MEHREAEQGPGVRFVRVRDERVPEEDDEIELPLRERRGVPCATEIGVAEKRLVPRRPLDQVLLPPVMRDQCNAQSCDRDESRYRRSRTTRSSPARSRSTSTIPSGSRSARIAPT